jgi:hypothetical protein
MRIRIAVAIGIGPAIHLDQGAGEYAARIAFAREDADVGFALLDELLAVGGEPGANRANGSANGHHPLELREPINGNGRLPASVNGNGSSAAPSGSSSPAPEPLAKR